MKSPRIYKLVTYPENNESDLTNGVQSTKMNHRKMDKDDRKRDYSPHRVSNVIIPLGLGDIHRLCRLLSVQHTV